MILTPGTRLAEYEVLALLGEGGMGAVYRARDTRLERQVALKLVLDPFLADRERVLRFEREAKTLASLNHPNIATLHGIEQADGRKFLVMELVDGETLDGRIARHPSGLPLEDALQIAKQIAEALEAAHEKGIVHRDLKPANVKITGDDKVKVLDFGLARVAESHAGASSSSAVMNSPTMSGLATQAGVILGTASYMSPEQARGYPADHRSDIFSFGVVLYEMLTGRSAFPGETISDVLASVLAREPDLTALPRDVAPRLTELLRRCLEKHPKRRWQAIGDVRYEVESLLVNPRVVPTVPAASEAPEPPRPLWRRAAPLAAVAVLAALLTAGAVQFARPSAIVPVVARFPLTLPAGQAISTFTPGVVAISPDGRRIAYIVNSSSRQIVVRPLERLETRQIFETDMSQTLNNLVFSPDGRSVAFFHDGAIKRMSVDGGAPLTLATTHVTPRGMSWTADALLVSLRNRIISVPANGGTAETLIELPSESASNPRWLPDGETILFTVAETASANDDAQLWESAKIVAQRPGDAGRTTVLDAANDGRLVASGHLLYARRGVLFAAPFDAKTLRVLAAGVPVVEGVRRGQGPTATGSVIAAVSDDGTLVYMPGPALPTHMVDLSLGFFDRSGIEQLLQIPAGPYFEPRISPDGRHAAFGSDDGRDVAVWVYDIKAGGSPRRLTFGGRDRYPAWSADSRRVTFQSDRDGSPAIYWQPADGSGVAERLTTPAKGHSHVPLSWSGDGVLLFDDFDGTQYMLMALTLADRSVQAFGNVKSGTPTGGVFSPNGRWVAYSVRNGAYDMPNIVFVQPYPATGALFQVSRSTEDGHHQVWSPDGTELYYTPGPGALLISVPVKTTPAFAMGERLNLPRPFTNNAPTAQRTYDAAPGRFLGLAGSSNRTDSATQMSLQVVLNWFQELGNR